MPQKSNFVEKKYNHQPKGVTMTHRKKTGSPKYPPDRKYYQNWIDLENTSIKYNNYIKNYHIKTMIKKEIQNDEIPSFLYLMFRLRTYCIIMAYFPEGSIYHHLYKNYENLDGWDDTMTDRERKLLYLFKDTVHTLEKDPRDTKCFTKVDKLFGKYRYDRWLLSQ